MKVSTTKEIKNHARNQKQQHCLFSVKTEVKDLLDAFTSSLPDPFLFLEPVSRNNLLKYIS